MRKQIWIPLAGTFILVVSFIAFDFTQVIRSAEVNQFLPDGPDKAVLRDFWMMRDPATNRVPMEELADLKLFEQSARLESERDFKWQNYDTRRPGRGRFIFHETQSGAIFSGSVTGGLYVNNNYSEDGGRWEKHNSFPDLSVSCMVADPTNPNRLFIGTGESFTAFLNYRESTGIGNGIFVSEDRGLTWSPMESTEGFSFINDIIIREEDGSGVIYAAVGSGTYQGSTFIQEGLYRSVDYGSSWTQTLPNVGGNEFYQVSDIELSTDNTIYVGTMRNGTSSRNGGLIFKSTDGVNWQTNSQIFDDLDPLGGYPGRIVIKSAPQNSNHLYALATNGYYNSFGQLRDYEVYLYQSFNAGASWSKLPLPIEQWANIPWHALAMAVDPTNEDRIVIGALNVYVLNNSSNVPSVEEPWAVLSRWYAMYNVEEANSPGEQTYWESIYVHGDIHDIQFYENDPDHILMSTDGGVFGTTNLSAIHSYNYEVPSEGLVKFNQIGIGLNTTQYYAVDLHPEQGKFEFLGGTQDNGSIYAYRDDRNDYSENWISGGDGGYVFFDEDTPDLKITSVYGNRWYFHHNGNVYFTNWVDGLFVNPADYDDEANLLYTNPSTSSNGGLYTQLNGRYFDSLRIINVNKYLQTDDLQLDTTMYVPLNTGLDEAITAIKLIETGEKLSRTLFIGTEYGKVFRVDGLPYEAVATRIDNDQINIGYISSIDLGYTSDDILITISNFGLSSVYVTRNGGKEWSDLDRNLPDMPVRWGVFNPFDDYKLMIATEMGVWGLENTSDTNEEWQPYNGNMPAIRVDMIKLRASDSTILAGTHGAGLWWGKIDQGETRPLSVDIAELANPVFYPNPFESFVNVNDSRVDQMRIYNLNGQIIRQIAISQTAVDLSFLESGPYIMLPILKNGSSLPPERMIKLP